MSSYNQGYTDGGTSVINSIVNIILVIAMMSLAFQFGRAWEVVEAERAQQAASVSVEKSPRQTDLRAK